MVFVSSSMFEDVYLDGAGLAIFLVLLAVMVLAAVAVNVVPRLVHRWETEYRTRDITYGAACLAMGYALSWAGASLPQGGTVTIAALAPIFIYCYYFGFRKGIVVVAAYTLLQFTQGPYIVSPWSAFFDYIFPYFSLCVAGLFRYKPDRYAAFVKRHNDSAQGAKGAVGYWAHTVGGHWGIFVGAAVHMLLRYLSNTVSGIMFYDLYYGAGASLSYKLTYSLAYNSYGLIDSAITIAALVVMLSSRTFNIYMSATFADKKKLWAAVSEPTAEVTAPSVQPAAADTPPVGQGNARG